MSKSEEMRFEFGRNWGRFVRSKFTQERVDVARGRILGFLGRDSLAGLDFLDIGCGSGLHSLAAFQAGAGRIHSLDYDPQSVATTRLLWERAGKPSNWTIERGDVLDAAHIARLGRWNFVYSWGVLHHTGQMWRAIANAQSTVADDGLFYIALYSSDADFKPSKEFWLEVKQRYNRSSEWGKRRMVWWYVWHFILERKVSRTPDLVKRALQYKFQRGMDLFADIRDWLGGWPMEYAGDQETVDLLEQKHGFRLMNVATGQACSEFLFRRDGPPVQPTRVKGFVAPAATPAAEPAVA
jgi:2-polyprenyl-6-hydroxyphenyl methylase/3-demethylubiquinone-9 3-methyltransferase